MKRITNILGVVAFLVISLGSCNNRDNETIEQQDWLAETDPQSSLEKISHVDTSNFDKYEQMRLKLIKYKIEDKLFVSHKSDSAINSLNDYFQKHGTVHDKLQSLYYMGSTYRDMGDFPSAIIMYEQAIGVAESNMIDKKDSLPFANVHSQSAEILYRIGDHREALQQAAISYKIRKKMDAVDIVTYEDMGRMSESCGKMVQAKEFYLKALMGIIGADKTDAYIDYLGEQLGFYTNHKRYDQAGFIYGIITKNKLANIPANVYAAIASYFIMLQQPDSALKYTLTAYQREERASDKAELAKNIALIAHEMEDRHTALKYAMLAMGYYDSAQEEVNAEGVKNAKVQRSLEEIREARIGKLKSQQKKKEYYMVGIIILLAAVLSVLSVLHLSNIKKVKMLTEVRRMKEEREKLKTEHTFLQNKVNADKKLRAETAPEISSVMKKVKDLSDSPKEKLQPDMWGAIFDAVDRLHPNLRRQLLTYNDKLENKDLILLYLMKLEFKQADIARIMKRAPSVISRKCHRIEGLLGVPLKEALGDATRQGQDVGDGTSVPSLEK